MVVGLLSFSSRTDPMVRIHPHPGENLEIWELEDLKEVVERFKTLEHENSTPREASVQEKRSRNSSGSPEISRGQNHVVETASKFTASAVGVEGSAIDFKQRLEVKEKEVSSVVLDERTRSPSLQSKVDNLIVDATKEKDSLTVIEAFT